MDAPLITFATTPWTNTPEATAQLKATRSHRKDLRLRWVETQRLIERLNVRPLAMK